MQIQERIYAMGVALHHQIINMQRGAETNQEWGTLLKQAVKRSLDEHLAILGALEDVDVVILDMPYTAETGSGRGWGENLITTHRVPQPELHTEKIYCLMDAIDGTWNATCGFPYSCSTMLAFTSITDVEPTDLTLAHFTSGFIIPYFGAGVYMSEFHGAPQIRLWNSERLPLHMSRVVSPSQTRVMIDLFTERNQEDVALSIPVVGPVIHDWCDFGRFYGAGAEITMLLGYRNIVPGFSAYIAASQKMDNILPTYALILGCGGVVTDWWGGDIFHKKLTDRVHVAMSANLALHNNLIEHLSKRPRPQENS